MLKELRETFLNMYQIQNLKNRIRNSIMFHFFMATNNEIGLRIANSVVNPKLGF